MKEKRGLRRKAERGAPRFAKHGQVGNAAVCSGGSGVVVSCGFFWRIIYKKKPYLQTFIGDTDDVSGSNYVE